jgi:acetylornithine/N-succinyldiaminopimelate aminotransferase
MNDSFHGRTFGALTATGQEKYHKGFGPMLPGFSYATFGDIESVRQLIDNETCAVMVEPVQGEGGVNMAPARYFQKLRALCDEKDCLLIFDEVQTGVARVGEWFGFQLVGVQPDVMTLAKALGGGVPIGATVAAAKVCDVLQPGTHASTFGGNPLACAAGLAVISLIDQKKGLKKAKRIGRMLRKRAEALREKFPVIKDIRGAGAMFGIELDKPGQPVIDACIEKNVLINCTHDCVLRFLTSVFLSEQEIDQAFEALEAGLKKL